MRIPRIYTDTPLAVGQTAALDDNAAQHVGRVLRMQPGQELRLFNGNGHDYPARIVEAGKKRVAATILEEIPNPSESPLEIVLAQTLSKGDRMDYAVQKATELGVTRIVPLTSERCDVRLRGDREDKRLKHWQQVAISAAEQCGRARVPQLMPVMSLPEWFDLARDCDLRLVLHHRTEQSLTTLARPTRVALMIGPEGGFSGDEVAAAEAAGFVPVALGPRVLRTETAPVAALTLCQWLWGDFGGHRG
ncbi:16S rRNA (uracil(1498)-N(3))-methyltransferase [Marinobacter lutaoensis]|jgi:16S rRNA (uracil1498-N3)-methyltransferase|uniref:Ribosomal RNA small subunit methyltransferase E n=1 Tax=Marinobacter lutaoensis TaxID=135739 RepID=A0A1V2DR41_9GAMM|nr:16S rRNA (uracil(1498)-N(3))-methyltransferase [Marinobacter lutaoensis]MBE01554.1 16S rRNA (uracil(1498)-N(3))-methyltransferase [Marinobacter sp.]MBI42831.1 16S rRNA (uracil(1498)-N(3))-methyltransferase [Oceanospirillales bacterium]NVD34858.1 16S rRNA (uracil(1498)-N(3))-methyltransferase [Marinobacter lutaoensis]ONF43122.1 16S rRNA (uracil(1498)-N(3))-methyltransferase [Marinobacter lutaoensis]|tara:strand:- start:1966 stop:2709 length:744 start_codon:yes stop_codon:yes gene_type:complete